MKRFSLGELADKVGGTVAGDRNRPIQGVATLETAGELDLSFLTNPRYADRARETGAGATSAGAGGGAGADPNSRFSQPPKIPRPSRVSAAGAGR